jgi:cytochrome c peroxidase
MPEPEDLLTDIPFDTTSYVLIIPPGFPRMEHPANNPQTNQGVKLGRMLFFDPILSLDSTISCASCHKPELSFTDGLAVSPGVGGLIGRRSSMTLLNVGFHQVTGFFWDGRSKTLEDQALVPIEDLNEMANTWEEVETRLRRHPDYPTLFREAFGIETKKDINRDLAVKAIAQFERTLISSGDSDYDRFDRNEFSLDDEANNGLDLFFDDKFPDAECGHCHNRNLFTIPEFRNNGLDPVQSVDDYVDKGLGEVTGLRSDNAKFKVPTLRNILLTAPYMHDGRFATIEEVLDHYNSGGHHVANQDEDNVDNLMEPQGLSERDKRELIAFMAALTDSTFIKNPAFQNPF